MAATNDATIEFVGASDVAITNVREFVALRQRGRQLLSAARTADGRLTLMSWRVNADGSVTRTGVNTPQLAVANGVALVKARKFVLACRTATGTLRLTSWDVSNTGAIYAAVEYEQPGPLRRTVRALALSEQLLITASITKERTLLIESWQLREDGSFSPLATVTMTAIRDTALVALPTHDDELAFATALRTQAGHVKLIQWAVTGDGQLTVQSKSDELPGIVTHLSAMVDHQGQVVTALRTPVGTVRLVGWCYVPEADNLQPSFDSGEIATAIRHVALMSVPDGLLSVLTTENGAVRWLRWAAVSEHTLMLRGESTNFPASIAPVTLCPEMLDGNAPIVTGVQTTLGSVRWITWRSA
jgi:hypothetical protein